MDIVHCSRDHWPRFWHNVGVRNSLEQLAISAEHFGECFKCREFFEENTRPEVFEKRFNAEILA